MLLITDLLTDESDDIVINGDLELEKDQTSATIKTAGRRVSARYDDFILSDIAAGIERHILQRMSPSLKFAIQDDIRNALTQNGLMESSDYKAFLLDQHSDGGLPIILKFNSPLIESDYSFSTLINNQNQRSYN